MSSISIYASLYFSSLSPILVFTAGLIAGLNPCLLAILAFMASILLTAKGKMKAIYTTLAFSMGIFTVYLLAGMGFFRVIAGSSLLILEIFKLALILIISLLGLWHLYDSYYISRKKRSSFATPKQIVELAEKAGGRASYPQAFLLGVLFSIVKAPCVGAIYFAILELIMKEQAPGLFYLALYNLGLIFPVIILGCAMAFGLSPEKVDKFRKEKRAMLRLITGILLMALAILMALNII
jgi:cytochrome c biogenesis protein CcdA